MDDAALTLPAGSLIAERYRVIGHLGSGGMGSVYRVEHTLMAKELALKLLKPELSQMPAVVERFEREARSAARLDHPGIVRVTDFGKLPDGALFMVMELVEGRALSDVIADGRLDADRAIGLVAQVLAALEHAHDNGVVHRDIKPANIMVAAGDRAKLVDFGIAKITASEETALTQVGAVMGTPRYMSPEQAAGEPVDARSDLYSVGVLLFELLSGKPPFTGSSVEVLSKHLTQAPPPLTPFGVDAARALRLQSIVKKALEKKREQRFDSATAFAASLGDVGRPVSPLAAQWHRVVTGVRAKPAVPAAIAIVLAIVLLAAVASRGGGTSSEVADLIGHGEAAVGRGDLPAARAIALQALAKDPEAPRAHLLQATIALADDHGDLALASLRDAITRDRRLAADPLVETAVRAQVTRDTKAAAGFVELLATESDARSAPLFAEIARTAPKATMRKDAFAALEKWGETARVDALAWLTEELKKGPGNCAARKWYVDRLIALHDARALPTLKKELGRKGGFLGLESVSDCMATDLRAEIKALEPPKPSP